MYYEAGTVLRTHPHVDYNDGIRRIFLYADGELPEDSDENDIKLKNLLKYINESITDNATDDNTRRLDDIVRNTKAKKDIGIRYMKSWEWEKEIRDESHAEGRIDEKLVDIRNLMSSMKWSAEQAMQALKIPEADRPKYSAKL